MRQELLLGAGRAIAFGLLLIPVVARAPLRVSPLRDFPKVTLWAWEQREDLLFIDTRRFGVAYLDATITISNSVEVVPRRQPLAVSPETTLIAVTRIEAHPGIADLSDPTLPARIAEVIARSAAEPQVKAIQVDFDARQSQRTFYRWMLRELRRRLPKNVPLSITALASWCAYDDWLRDIPVDEAVPMFFAMGPDHPASDTPGWTYPIREPLCRSIAGVSMNEAWPKLDRGTRLYVFHQHAWNAVSLKNLTRYLPK